MNLLRALRNKNSLDWVKIRAEEDMQKLIHLSTNNCLVIISIDMQISFLNQIDERKRNVLVKYHEEIKKISKLNKIDFIEVSYEGHGENALTDESSLKFEKKNDWIDKSLSKNLSKNSNIYLIGINRSACLIISIFELFKQKKFNLFTSIIGTGNTEFISNYAVKNKLKTKKNESEYSSDTSNLSSKTKKYIEYYSSMDINSHGLKEFLDGLLKMDVNILDYNLICRANNN